MSLMEDKPKRVPRKPFVQGNTYGSLRAMPKDVKAAMALARTDFKACLTELYFGSDNDLAEAMQRGHNGKKLIAQIWYQAHKQGSIKHQQLLVDRLLGAVKQEINVSGEGDLNPLRSLSNEDLFKIVIALRDRVKANDVPPVKVLEGECIDGNEPME